jgi:hypothetical protein
MSGRRVAVAAGLLLVAGLSAGIARAMIPDAAGTIHACFKSSNGQLRIVAAAGDCLKNEQSLDWQQVGPTGAQGPQGPQGKQGQQGPPGGPGSDGLGVSGYQIVADTGTTTTQGNDVLGSAAAVCPQFTTLVGGGYELPSSADVTVKKNNATYLVSGDEWIVEVWGQSGVSFTAYAICVDQQPLEGS